VCGSQREIKDGSDQEAGAKRAGQEARAGIDPAIIERAVEGLPAAEESPDLGGLLESWHTSGSTSECWAEQPMTGLS